MIDERAVFFESAGESLFGIMHSANTDKPKRGLVVVVGGPQYRVGSHRQFVLLARAVASAGYPVLRFDYRGMGDSTGPSVDFESIDDDIAAAVDSLCSDHPSIESVTLWGLCDAASAALFYAGRNVDPRIGSLVLLNPWVRTEQGEARAQATGYYGRRATSVTAWLGVLRSPRRALRVLKNLAGIARRLLSRAESTETSLPERVMAALSSFHGDVLLLMSGNDLTAREFLATAQNDQRCVDALRDGAIKKCDLEEADHTFSTATWRHWVERQTIDWLRQ